MNQMPRPLYILYRVFHDLVAVLSRFINATFFGGSTHQSLSSRAHVDSKFDPEWKRRRLFINGVFFWQEDHCEADWLFSVDQALKVLERNDALLVSDQTTNGIGESA